MAVRERHLVYTTIQPGATEPKNEHLTNVQTDKVHANIYGQTSMSHNTVFRMERELCVRRHHERRPFRKESIALGQQPVEGVSAWARDRAGGQAAVGRWKPQMCSDD